MYRIGDFLIQIKNAYQAHKLEISYKHTKVVEAIGRILEQEGYIGKLEIVANPDSKAGLKTMNMKLIYNGRVPAITNVKLVSKPSVHHYSGKNKLGKTSLGHGIGILSTSKGMMTVKNARKQNVGGEIIAQIS